MPATASTTLDPQTLRTRFPLEPGAIYLNHGTVGVTPYPVLRARAALLEEIERHPARFMLRELMQLDAPTSANVTGALPRLRRAAAAVQRFLGGGADDDEAGRSTVFVDNATAAVNAVVRAQTYEPGSEILVHDHAYGGVERAIGRIATERGWRLVPCALEDGASDAAWLAALDRAITPRTRLALIDHVSSETALVMPLAALATVCKARGVDVLVDGAHAPGAIEVNVASLGVDWYAANLHKWAFAPRSCGVLWAAPGRRAGLQAPVYSWAATGDDWLAAFDWAGTRDPTPWLAAPAGIDFLESVLGSGEALRVRNHAMAMRAAALLSDRWQVPFTTPEARIGCMVAVPLPALLVEGDTARAQALRDLLLHDHRIEVPVLARHGRLHVRVSLQIYNDEADVERLADAVLSLAART